MAVTELAVLRLLSAPLTASAKAFLRRAAAAMTHASGGIGFTFHACVEDERLVYLLGGWPSVEFHMEMWIPGAANQALLKEGEGEVAVEWMLHLDVEPRAVRAAWEERWRDREAVVSVERYFVVVGGENRDEQALAEVNAVFDGYARAREGAVGGWRVGSVFRGEGGEMGQSGKGADEEFVLFAPWESLEKQAAIAQREDLEDFSRIRNLTEELDVKHAAVRAI